MTGGHYISVIIIANYVSHFLFISGFCPPFSNTIIRIGWYVGALVIVYLLVMLYHRYKKVVYAKFTLIYIISIIICLSSVFLSAFFKNQDMIAYFRRFSVWAQLPIIASGLAVYLIYNNTVMFATEEMRSFLSTVCRVVSIVLLISLFTVNLSSPFGQIAFGLCFGIFVFSLLVDEKSIFNNTLFRLFGKYSLGIYLLHPIVITLLRKYGVRIGNVYISWIINYIMICFGSLFLGIFAHYLIEVPFLTIIKKSMIRYDSK